MKQVLIALILSFIIPFNTYSNVSEDIIIKNVMDASSLFFGNKTQCTSVHINFGKKIRHLTAEHCCKESKNVTVSRMGKNKNLKVIKTDKLLDLCEIESLPILTKLNLSRKLPEPLMVVYNFGMSGRGIFFEKGRLNNLVEPLNGIFTFYSSNFTIEGMSGGALLDENGDLFGILIQRTQDTYQAISISSANIEWFLNR